MPRRPKAIVLDSWAVIAYLEAEPAAEKVADHIAELALKAKRGIFFADSKNASF